MDNQKTQDTSNTQQNNEPKLKTWDEAIKELGSFIRKTKAEEAQTKEEQE